ncbi:MAG: hypothetical protein Q7R30_22010 [Acidobacteriota bacterium]|nr:hypothetical protein [Acidobacteriota bacterium]
MKRSLVFALILSFGDASVAMAGETLLQSGKRITRQVAQARPASASIAREAKRLRIDGALQPALQAQPGLAQSGLRKRTKLLIAFGVAVAFGGVAYAIDHGVEDSTPSSLGQR